MSCPSLIIIVLGCLIYARYFNAVSAHSVKKKNLPLNLPEPFAGHLLSFLFQTNSAIIISALQSLMSYVHHSNLISSRTRGLVLARANSLIISSCNLPQPTVAIF